LYNVHLLVPALTIRLPPSMHRSKYVPGLSPKRKRICTLSSVQYFTPNPTKCTTKRKFLTRENCIKSLPKDYIENSSLSHSIQSARPSFQSSELAPPPPHVTRKGLWDQGGRLRDRLAFGGGGAGGNPILTKGQTLWYSMYNTIPLRSLSTVSFQVLSCPFILCMHECSR
jgi:hypothetical protein